MSVLSPVPPLPIRDDPTQDATWKRWFNQLQSNMGGLGGFSSGAVLFADAGGNPTSDTAFTFNASTNVLTVNGSTFGTNTQIGGTLGVTGNTTLTGDLSVQGNTTIGNASADTLTANAAAWTLVNATTVTGTWANLGTVTTIDINGGTIDGVTIGGSSAGAGTFTTGSFSSTLTLSGTAANIALGSNFISNGGTDAGLSLDASNNATLSGTLSVNGTSINSTAATFNLLNATVTTLNLGSAATTLAIGATASKIGFGASVVDYYKYHFGGTLASGGGSTIVVGIAYDGTITAANGDTSYHASFNMTPGGITTQGNSETIGVVASARFAEPTITVGTGDTVTVAATVYIANAPTEGVTNAALYVASGATYLQSLNVASTLTLTGTAANISLGSNYLSGDGGDEGISVDSSGNVTCSGTVAVNGASITTDDTTFAVFNTNATTVNAFGAATTLNMGASTVICGIGVAASSSTFVNLPAGTTAKSTLRVPHGSAPTSPVDGDIWTTTAGLFVRINGSTVGPLS